MKRRFRSDEIDGALPATGESSPSEVKVETDASATGNRHDPIGWLLKRLGVLFLVAVTIAVALLIALPRGHATMTPHQRHLLPKALSPGRI